MRARLSIIVSLVLFVGVPSACAPQYGPATDRLDPYLTALFDMGAAPGFAVVVVQGTEVAYLRGFGYANAEAGRRFTPRTVAYIASSTKSFTGLTAALLNHAGVLDLDAPVSRYLPQLRLAEGLDPAAITVRDLLTHTHGITNGGPVVTRTAFTGEHSPEVLLDVLRAHGPAPNGRTFRYGNIGYNVAGLVMEAATAEHWKDLERRLVFEPLGMSSTTGYRTAADPDRLAMPYRARPDSGFERLPFAKTDENMHAAGGLLASTEDLARWLQVNLTRGALDGRRVFPEAVVRATHTAMASQTGNTGPFRRVGYSLGWNLALFHGDTVVYHNGGFPGHRANVSFMPEHQIGVAVVANESDLGGAMADLITAYVYDRLLSRAGHEAEYADWLTRIPGLIAEARDAERADRERRAARAQVLPHPGSAYTGLFANPLYGTMEFRLVDGRLMARAGVLETDAIEVYDGERHQLRIELAGRGDVVTFEFEDGRAIRLRMGPEIFQRVER